MSWNYRVIKQGFGLFGEEETIFGIHEVYYNEDGIPNGYTEDFADVAGVDIEGLLWVLDKMREAIDKPVLTPKDFVRDKDNDKA